VAGVVSASSAAGQAERLAGITGSEDTNAATPREAVEGSKVTPDRRLIQGLVRHPSHESGRSVAFPLDETNSSIGWLCDVQAEVKAGIAGAQGEPEEVVGLGLELGT
jgi:hypothetical protein